jgi:hypothetical protein
MRAVPTPVTEIATRVVQTSSGSALPQSASWPQAQQHPPSSYRSASYPAAQQHPYPYPPSHVPSSYPTGTSVPRARTPGIYIVASVFFLAIAAAGFGVWLAFEVISL